MFGPLLMLPSAEPPGRRMSALLPAAVPPPTADYDAACREVGRLVLYVAQLSGLLRERAQEANQLHEELAGARAQVDELGRQTLTLRARAEAAEVALLERRDALSCEEG